MIRVALADDHPVVRAGVVSVLEGLSDVTVAAQFGSAEELLAWLDGHSCDLLLLDLHFGDGLISGAEATRRITASGGPAVLILTTYAVRLSALALEGLLAPLAAHLPGQVQPGEMAIREETRNTLLPTAIFARWSR